MPPEVAAEAVDQAGDLLVVAQSITDLTGWVQVLCGVVVGAALMLMVAMYARGWSRG